MKKYIMIFLLAGLLIIVYKSGVKVGRGLAEKEMSAENSELNTDLEMMREEESDTQNEKADEKTDETKEIQGDIIGKRRPVEYRNMSDLGGPKGFLDEENTVFWKDYYKDYNTIFKQGVEYHIPICLQDSLQDYFSLRDPNEDIYYPKDIYCMFYDDRTIV